jgi:transcriptional regulator with XRE-family HTH domain
MKNIKGRVGQRVRQLRKAKGWSQEQFAFECGLDQTYISGIENGRRNVSIVNVEKMCKAFGVSLKEFFDAPDFR